MKTSPMMAMIDPKACLPEFYATESPGTRVKHNLLNVAIQSERPRCSLSPRTLLQRQQACVHGGTSHRDVLQIPKPPREIRHSTGILHPIERSMRYRNVSL